MFFDGSQTVRSLASQTCTSRSNYTGLEEIEIAEAARKQYYEVLLLYYLLQSIDPYFKVLLL